MRVLSVSGFLGYGFPESSFRSAISQKPDAIVCDAGTNDAGPFYLGSGASMTSQEACRRDLWLMLEGGHALGVPVIVGSAWTAGTDQGVDTLAELVRAWSAEKGISVRLAKLYSEISATQLCDLYERGNLELMGGESMALTRESIEEVSRAVCAMGATPIMRALDEESDVIIAGRASDAALTAALPLVRQAPPGFAWQAGRILECGACAAEPADTADCLMTEVRDDGLTVWATNPKLRCTAESVAAHMLYETPHPYVFREPEGTLDTRDVQYEQHSSGSVLIRGNARFIPGDRYSMRVEGVRSRGYRSIALGGVRDPALIRNGAEGMRVVRSETIKRVEEMFGSQSSSWMLRVLLYGVDGVLGDRESEETDACHEIAVLLDVVARSQEEADAILALARAHVVHGDFPGRLNINAGNLAFPFSPSDVPVGEVFEFLPAFVVNCDSPWNLVRMEVMDIPGTGGEIQSGGRARGRS